MEVVADGWISLCSMKVFGGCLFFFHCHMIGANKDEKILLVCESQ